MPHTTNRPASRSFRFGGLQILESREAASETLGVVLTGIAAQSWLPAARLAEVATPRSF